jgi:hypothetical protein
MDNHRYVNITMLLNIDTLYILYGFLTKFFIELLDGDHFPYSQIPNINPTRYQIKLQNLIL